MARLGVLIARAWAGVLLAGCGRSSPAPVLASDARYEEPSPAPAETSRLVASAAAPPSSAGPLVDARADVARRADPPGSGEADRKTIARLEDEPILVPHLPRLRAHFGDSFRGPFLLQRVALAAGRVAVLVSLAPDETDPIVLVIEHDAVLWEKEHPTGGITPPVHGLALAAHPDGGAVLFAFVPAVATIAGRIWADDGGAFADLQVMPTHACEALSAAYSPGVGWLVVAARRGGARAQLVRETATMAWGDGVEVGMAWHRTAPIGIGVDSASSFVLVQLARVGSPPADHVVAFRYDTGGLPLWPTFKDLGATMDVARGHERPTVKVTPEGRVRVRLDEGVLASKSMIDVPL